MNRAHKLDTTKRAATIYHELEKRIQTWANIHNRFTLLVLLLYNWAILTFTDMDSFLLLILASVQKTTLFCTHACFPPWREEQTEDWLLGTCCSSAEMWTVLSWTCSWDSSASCFFCLASASWNMRTPHQILQAQPIMIQAKPNWSIPVMKTAQSHPWYSTSVQLAITVPNPTHHPFSAIGTWNNTVHNKIRNGRGASNLRDSEEVTISVRFLCSFGWHKKYYAFCGSNPWGYG